MPFGLVAIVYFLPSTEDNGIVLLPAFQKGRDIEPSQGKGHGAVLAQKRAICVVQGKTLKMRKTDRISVLLGSIRCFFISFNTFKTLYLAP
jgi:hypothetical protein